MKGIDMKLLNLTLAAMLLCFVGCDATYYKTMETFGKHKRDILVNNVCDARDSQQDTKEQFKTALEKFTEVANFQGGRLKEKYEMLNSELEKSEKKASTMRKHIASVADVADDLFEEWEIELEEYSNQNLRNSSESKLRQTKYNYVKLITAMRNAESRIEPVLAAFRDQVLFLKHNLNAQAIASLQNELVTIETNIGTLVKEMEASINEADAFIRSMSAD